MKIVGLLQARVGSRRLPGKVLEQIGGRPALEQMLTRLRASQQLDDLVVCTSETPADARLAATAQACGTKVFLGSEPDVLDRLYQASVANGADVIARLTGDCVLHDAAIVDRLIGEFVRRGNDETLVCNKWPFSWPDGYDVEVCSRSLFERVSREAHTAFEREHVFPYVYGHRVDFTIVNVCRAGDDLFHRFRLVLDYPEDLVLMRRVAEGVGLASGCEDIVRWLENNPDVARLNERYLPTRDLTLAWQNQIVGASADDTVQVPA